jgi:hypothetical protein
MSGIWIPRHEERSIAFSIAIDRIPQPWEDVRKILGFIQNNGANLPRDFIPLQI